MLTWNTDSVSDGTHILTAVAKDVEGNQTISSSVLVSVNNVNELPSELKIGDKIKTTAWINVRSTAGGKSIGTQRTGKTGTITAGPGYACGLNGGK